MQSKKIAFAVQGEGRGHLTQAIAMADILKKQGHILTCVIVGCSKNRQLPDFFLKKFSVPLVTVASPNFVTDKNSKSINLGKTVVQNMMQVATYAGSVKKIKHLLKEYQPDLLINFYEPLIGWLAVTSKTPFKIISIAHQFIYLHPQFKFPGGENIESTAVKWYTKMTAFGSTKLLAISMYNLPTKTSEKLKVCPPLLRTELFGLRPIEDDFVLVYLLNSGYIPEIINYHKKDPSMRLICFTDSKEVKEHYKGKLVVDENLTFYSLNDTRFLDLMSRCKALVCTAGFESVCEAMYLDKPVMMVPVTGHYEQYCNARDASKIGAGIYAKSFDLSMLKDCIEIYDRQKNIGYRNWVGSFETTIVKAIEAVFQDDNAISKDGSKSPQQFLPALNSRPAH
jgi:uncharacterized protein (TIGR00661 family)